MKILFGVLIVAIYMLLEVTNQMQIEIDEETSENYTDFSLSERIIKGMNTDITIYPFTVLLARRSLTKKLTNGPFSPICSGSLVGKNRVLTAGHCVDVLMKQSLLYEYRILLGATDLTNPGPASQNRTVLLPLSYLLYNPFNLKNDLALLSLDKPVSFTDHIQQICLAPKDFDPANKNHTVAGWGTTSQGGPVSTVLQSLNVPVLPNQICKDIYGNQFKDTMMCAENVNGSGPCNGDSGGPLFYKYASGKYFQDGIVSWGAEGCGNPDYPTVYTEIKDVVLQSEYFKFFKNDICFANYSS